MDKPFAIKMLPSILVANKRAYRQLKDEALVAMRLVHPNIVQRTPVIASATRKREGRAAGRGKRGWRACRSCCVRLAGADVSVLFRSPIAPGKWFCYTTRHGKAYQPEAAS